jgi:hypothetical protein
VTIGLLSKDATLNAEEETAEHFNSAFEEAKSAKAFDSWLAELLFCAKIKLLVEVVAVLATVAAIRLKNLCAGATKSVRFSWQ